MSKSMRTSALSAYVGGQWRRRFEKVANNRTIAVQVLVPMWTTEDMDNLVRRVERLSGLAGKRSS